jgi:hypothetical protein
MMRPRTALLLLLTPLALGCQDPVHSDRVAMLGGEVEGLRRGPLHRPGQPCTYCHGGQGPARAVFDLAGTVFQYPSGDTRGIGGVSVDLIDRYARIVSIDSNETGNFYFSAGQLDLEFPLKARITAGGTQMIMNTPIFRARSCAECHSGQGPHSVSRIYLEAP